MQSEFPQKLFAQTELLNCRIMHHHHHKSISESVGIPGDISHASRPTGDGVVYENEPAEERRARQVGRRSSEIFASFV